MAKYLNETGLAYFWAKIKEKLNAKVDKETGKGLSANDYTTAEKEKLAGVAEGANRTTVENALTSTSTANALSAAQGKALKDQIDQVENSLDSLDYGDMKKTAYDADNDGKVDAALHADSADTAASAASAGDADKLGGQLPSYYARAADIPAVPTAVAQLTDAGDYAKKTDIANVYKYRGSVETFADLPSEGLTAGDVYSVEGDKGMNYGWTGTAWDPLGEVFSIESITNGAIDTILSA